MSTSAGCSRAIMRPLLLAIALFIIPTAKGAIPGTFFWKPRLGIDLIVPTPKPSVNQTMVLISGYQAGLTLLAFTDIYLSGRDLKHLNLGSAHFYTNAYRWALRHLSLIPEWFGDRSGGYAQTHQVWKKRFNFMHELVPEWMRPLFFYVKKSEWQEVIDEEEKFRKVAEPAFGEWYKYPKYHGPDY